MRIFCKVLGAHSAEAQVEVDESSTVLQLKHLLYQQLPWLPSDFKILFKGKPLKLDDQISDYKMKDGDKITLMLPKESKTRSTADEVKTSDQDVEALFYAKLRTVCLTKLPEPDVNEFLKHFHEIYRKAVDSLSPDDIERICSYQLTDN
ncbi:ubiquitin-like protein 4A isoform X2 [Convolutriloba macropyga]|uniref:ubiquitin-like protein 4A isoform X2 n=1 Tax=Convolutriloba macropyga TaxID=536237 RepID=UPI003F51B7D2